MASRGIQCCAFKCNKRKRARHREEFFRSDSEGSDDDESHKKRKFRRTFHVFPKNIERKNQWVANIHRDGWSPTIHSQICSDHFLEKHINRSSKIVRLNADAVPTRFKMFPSHIKKVSKERKAPQLRTVGNGISEPEDNNNPPSAEVIKNDHSYFLESPRELKEKCDAYAVKLHCVKKQLKITQQRSRRLSLRNKSLQQIIKLLREKNMISTNCEERLLNIYSDVPIELLRRITSKKGKGSQYSAQLKTFALTLQFYSAKAYEFVRKTFKLALPHQSQVRRWYGKIPAEPGFTKPSFLAIEAKVESAKATGKNVICAVMVDEMAIRKHISWDGIRFRGYVDLGNEDNDDDTSPVAKNVLVFMAVCMNDHWKVPLGYFFIDGLSGSERANLVSICMQRLADTGTEIASMTCDGPSCHFAMLGELGACLVPNTLKPHFPHPLQKDEKIYVFLDVCHMLKLVRNTLSESGILLDSNGNQIKWHYLKELQILQESEGLRLGNKLKLSHINWFQQKMKVNLAAQTFSSSVADALEYCATSLKLRQFEGCAATVKFIRIINDLFDILNSRNIFGKNHKSALRVCNINVWGPFLKEAYQYLFSLKDASGRLMHTTKRKTGIIGFLIAIKSIEGIFNDFINIQNPSLNYLLTYKVSQDHLELFFSAVRSAGGFNNNPTAQQFIGAYKRLLLRSHIQGENGNSQKQDPTEILQVISDNCIVNGVEISISNTALIRKYDLSERKPAQGDHDYSDRPNAINLSEYKVAALSFMAGYVGKMMCRHLTCIKCTEALGSTKLQAMSSFMALKDRGGLFKPSSSLIMVCEETEKCFQRMLSASDGNLPHCKGIPNAISVAVLGAINISKTFESLNDHMFDSAVGDNHVFSLIKGIARCYCKIRLHHLGKELTAKLSETKVRKKFTKLILFNHQ